MGYERNTCSATWNDSKKKFIVLCLLQFEKVFDRASKFSGVLINISEQSMIHIQKLLKYSRHIFLKHFSSGPDNEEPQRLIHGTYPIFMLSELIKQTEKTKSEERQKKIMQNDCP